MRKNALVRFVVLCSVLASFSVSSYGIIQAHAASVVGWNASFAFSCNDPASMICGPVPGQPGTSGDRGTCTFLGSTDGGFSGNMGSCEITLYARTTLGQPANPTHESISITGWSIHSLPFLPEIDYLLVNAGSANCTGPDAPSCPSPVGTGVFAGVNFQLVIPGHISTILPKINYEQQVDAVSA